MVTAGTGERTVVVVPGTNFCAASCLPLLSVLAARCRVVAVDLPGQPGLSAADRVPTKGRLAWYGRWLEDAVGQITTAPVTVLGHSLGAAITLACASPLVSEQVLVSPGGLMRLHITPRVALASVSWLLARSPAASALLLRAMHGRARRPRPELVEWMTLVARHVRTSTDPGAAVIARHDVRRTVVVGDEDAFLPVRTLAPVVLRSFGVELGVIAAAGHLITDEVPEALADAVL